MPKQDHLQTSFNVPSFSVGSALLTAVAVAGLTAVFWYGDVKTQATLNFLVLAGAVGAGGLSAYYVWKGLETSVNQRNQILEDERIGRAIGFMIRWNSGSNSDVRKAWLKYLSEIEEHPPLDAKALYNDTEKRAIVASVLNFCEEVGYSARSGAADMKTLEELFKGLCMRYYKATRPWVEYRRTGSNGNPKAWQNFEWLCDQWK